MRPFTIPPFAFPQKAPAPAPPRDLRSPPGRLRSPLKRGPPPANGHAARLAPSVAPLAAPFKSSRAPLAGSAYPRRGPSSTPRDARPTECGRDSSIGLGVGAGFLPGAWDEPDTADVPPDPEERGQPSGAWPGEGEDALEQVDDGADFDPWAIIDDPEEGEEEDAPADSPGDGDLDEEAPADSDFFEDADAEWAADAADQDVEDPDDAEDPDGEGREPADGWHAVDEAPPAREGDPSSPSSSTFALESEAWRKTSQNPETFPEASGKASGRPETCENTGFLLTRGLGEGLGEAKNM